MFGVVPGAAAQGEPLSKDTHEVCSLSSITVESAQRNKVKAVIQSEQSVVWNFVKVIDILEGEIRNVLVIFINMYKIPYLGSYAIN